MQVQAGKDHDDADKIARKRNKKIKEGASYRIEEASKLRGFAKERSFKQRFQTNVRQAGPEQNSRFVTDTDGEQTLRSRIKIVSGTNTSITPKPNQGNTQRDPTRRAATLTLAKKILRTIVGDTKNLATMSKNLSEEDKIRMKAYKAKETRKFLELHANLFTFQGKQVGKTEEAMSMLR